MKLKIKQLMGLALLTASGLVQADCSTTSGSPCSGATLGVDLTGLKCTPAIDTDNQMGYGQTFFSLRPQQSNTARNQMGDAARIHQFDKQEFNGLLSLALQWQQSTDSAKLGRWFFFNGSNSMTYGPNWAPDTNGVYDVNALNFTTTAAGTITASPRVQNFIADLRLYLGLDEFVEGLYLNFGVPVNYVRTDMRLSDVAQSGYSMPTTFHWGDVSDNDTTADTVPYNNLLSAWVGDKSVGDATSRTVGNINGRNSEVAVAGLCMEIGYEFLRREHGHLGLGLLVVAPTGNEPNPRYLFQAISGANNCWQIGLTANGAYELWNNNENSNLNLYLNAEVTHLSQHKQRRLMGLRNIAIGTTTSSADPSPGSSWIMLKKFNTSYTYAQELVPAANFLGLVAKIGNAVMGDVSLSLRYGWNNYGVALGYNFWGRSGESVSARQQSIFAQTDAFYAFKEATGTYNNPANAPTDMGSGTSVCATKSQTNIATAGTTVTGTSEVQANVLTDDDIAVCPALQPASITNKVFGTIEYCWPDNEWSPYILFGGSYEIGCKIDKTENASLSQWGVLAKGGISF